MDDDYRADFMAKVKDNLAPESYQKLRRNWRDLCVLRKKLNARAVV